MRFNTCFLFFFILLSGLFAVTAQANGDPSLDSIPRIDYIGYRLYLTHFELVKEKKGYLYIKLSAINTGNKNMPLGKGASQVFPVVKFDASINTAALNDYQTEIYFKLLEEKLTVPIGGIYSNIELKLLAEATDSKTDNQEPKEEVSPKEEIVESVPTKPAPLPVNVTTTPIEKSPEPLAIVEEPISTELPLEEPVVSEEPIVTEVPVEKPVVAMEETTVEETTIEAPIAAEEACADLVLQNITVLKRSKNAVTLEYELLNQGAGAAALVIGQKKEQESIAIRAHLSSSERLTRGAIVLESSFLHGDEVTLQGGETYSGQLKLKLHKLTKFTPVLILELDAFEFVSECDEHNNLSRLTLIETP